MTDLEINKLCAEAMGYSISYTPQGEIMAGGYDLYRPLHDDAQAMALVKKFRLQIMRGNLLDNKITWAVFHVFPPLSERLSQQKTLNDDLNRTICECVASMQEAKCVSS